MFISFCDFCECNDCKYGTKYIRHAQTSTGQWICDTCYQYDLCTYKPGHDGPCEDRECEHRPKIVSDWQPSNNKGEMIPMYEPYNMTDEEDDDNNIYPLPVEHPMLAHIAGIIYDYVYEPINKFISWVSDKLSKNISE